jgi:hypothetical protein
VQLLKLDGASIYYTCWIWIGLFSSSLFVRTKKKISFSLCQGIYNQSLQLAQIQKEKGLDERRDQNLSDARDEVKFMVNKKMDRSRQLLHLFIWFCSLIERGWLWRVRSRGWTDVCVMGRENLMTYQLDSNSNSMTELLVGSLLASLL